MQQFPEISRRQALGGLSATAALALAGWPGAAHASPGGPVTITVMGTSDLHGNCRNWNYFNDDVYKDSAGNHIGVAKVSSLVKQIRKDRGEKYTLLFDSGDTIQGTPLTTYYAKIKPITETGELHPMARAMNPLRYDAVTLGNHEFNYGIPLLNAWVEQMKAPVLGANALVHGTGKPAFRPYIVKQMRVPGQGRPIRVGVLGLTNPGSAVWDKDNVDGKLDFEDIVVSAKKWVKVLKDRERCDVVIVTAHAGDDGFSSYLDVNNGGTIPVENASKLVAQQVPGIDVIIFGHAHKEEKGYLTPGPNGEQVLVCSPSKWGMRLAVVDLTLTWKRGRWTVTTKTSTTVNANTVAEDPEIVAAVDAQHEVTKKYVNTVVATSTEAMSAAEATYKDAPIIDYIQYVQTKVVKEAIAGTEYASLPIVSIAAPFSRTAAFPAGEVSIKNIAGLYIFDNTLMAKVITGAQIKDYLEDSADYFNTVPVGAPVDVATLTNAVVNGQATPDYNYDHMSGVSYDIDISKPAGARIVNLTFDGAPVDPAQRFVIAVNNYRATGAGQFRHIAGAPTIYNKQVEIRQAMIDTAVAEGVIDPSTFAVSNWKLVREGVPVF
ncbi:bifunctional metallophosphatase/5'-nucleotidase [Nonomuraea sp. NPDC050663]|uniref:bifunctional metallophosphatase/5'-nucleotidase n=1 Tax=Nonomuraea sp. NPDC050663 TaxID=3364370 RepID=UPI0037A3B4C1